MEVFQFLINFILNLMSINFTVLGIEINLLSVFITSIVLSIVVWSVSEFLD